MRKMSPKNTLEPGYFDQFNVGDIVYDSHLGSEWVVCEKLKNGIKIRNNVPGGACYINATVDSCAMRFFKSYDDYFKYVVDRQELNGVSVAELAAAGAKKLCGKMLCIAPYDCGHEKEHVCVAGPLDEKAKAKTCPLAKYDAYQSSSKPWHECTADEAYITRAEILALCARCENSRFHGCKSKDGATLTRINLEDCLTCPVKAAEESMDECEAEQ